MRAYRSAKCACEIPRAHVSSVQQDLGHALAVQDVLLREFVESQRIPHFRAGSQCMLGRRFESVASRSLGLEILDFESGRALAEDDIFFWTP